MRPSVNAGVVICTPTGRRERAPRETGTCMAGSPARLGGSVKMSARYMASGSLVFSPRPNAGVGAVGESTASQCVNAWS
jgi:hypothetical protein